MRFFLLCLLTVIASIFSASLYAQRYALVIGNSQYKVGKLRNPVNDANAMATLLQKKGFQVQELTDANKRQINTAIRDFTNQLHQKNAVGLFYYAGHGVEIDGRNYLVPIGADIKNETDVEYESVDAGRVMAAMERAGNNLNIVILDACRDNPYARSFRSSSRGLARMDAAKGSLVLYATSPGDVASDGTGRNGLFTEHLMESIDTPDLKVEDVFKSTAQKVYKATDGKQLPWQSGVILDNFYFTEGAPESNTSTGRLTIKTSPDGAEIRILNILPKYQNGMELKPGRYHIEVSQSGYQRHTEWIDMTTGDQIHSVVLVAPSGEASVSQGSDRIQTAMKNIPAGCFQIGEDGRHKRRGQEVCVDGFRLGVKEVSVGEFRRFIRATNYHTEAEQGVEKKGCFAYGSRENTWAYRADRNWDNPGFSQTEKHPVVCVSWNDIQKYIGWLNRQTTGGYRLPTEAEWSYAARGGTQTAFSWGNAADARACSYANVNDKNWAQEFPCNDGYKFTAPIGTYSPNDFGLYDMTGNAFEWTCSEFNEAYSGVKTRCLSNNGSNNGAFLVARGGSFFNESRWLRLGARIGVKPWERGDYGGFRLARTR